MHVRLLYHLTAVNPTLSMFLAEKGCRILITLKKKCIGNRQVLIEVSRLVYCSALYGIRPYVIMQPAALL
jgi:hypothetical protein